MLTENATKMLSSLNQSSEIGALLGVSIWGDKKKNRSVSLKYFQLMRKKDEYWKSPVTDQQRADEIEWMCSIYHVFGTSLELSHLTGNPWSVNVRLITVEPHNTNKMRETCPGYCECICWKMDGRERCLKQCNKRRCNICYT